MKTYHIHREGKQHELGEVTVTVKDRSGGKRRNTEIYHTRVYKLELEPSLKIRSHSPTGFEFGHHGSGPAQLALAILMDFTGKVPHPEMYQRFKSWHLSNIPHPGGIIGGKEIQQFIDNFPGKKFMSPVGC